MAILLYNIVSDIPPTASGVIAMLQNAGEELRKCGSRGNQRNTNSFAKNIRPGSPMISNTAESIRAHRER